MTAHEVPAEVWGKIFELSCNDGGQTGRSLALVSRYMNAVSKPYQYQSIILVGPRAIEHFANLLTSQPEYRRVKHLFMSTFRPDPTVLDFILQVPLQPQNKPPVSPSPHRYLPDLVLKTNHTILSDMYRILEFIAPSIRNLHILMDFYREEIFFPMAFPKLEELSIQGPFHDHYDCNEEFCDTLYPSIPSLRRLYLTDVFTCINDRTYLAIRHYAPYLTHLRIQCADGYIESSRTFLRQLLPPGSLASKDEEEEFFRSYLERYREDDEESVKSKGPHFPESLQRILLYPGPAQPRGRCGIMYMIRCGVLRELEKCANDDPRVILFKESPWVWPYSREYGFIEGEKQWLDSIAGGIGGWEKAQ
jgi:hypothetical protein